jgi:hypothetical protein
VRSGEVQKERVAARHERGRQPSVLIVRRRYIFLMLGERRGAFEHPAHVIDREGNTCLLGDLVGLFQFDAVLLAVVEADGLDFLEAAFCPEETRRRVLPA